MLRRQGFLNREACLATESSELQDEAAAGRSRSRVSEVGHQKWREPSTLHGLHEQIIIIMKGPQ